MGKLTLKEIHNALDDEHDVQSDIFDYEDDLDYLEECQSKQDHYWEDEPFDDYDDGYDPWEHSVPDDPYPMDDYYD